MPERLSEEVVRHVAELARLEVTDAEVAQFSEQLSSIAEHFRDMDELNLEGVEPTTHALPNTNVFRKDVLTPGLPRDEVLAQAPSARDGQFMVPKILGDEQ